MAEISSTTQLKVKENQSVKRRTVLLRKEKETKRKVQYKEDGDYTTQIVQTIYLPKDLLGSPYPEVIEAEVRWI